MTPGSAGTAGDSFRVPVKEGRHRAPPDPPPPDRFIVPIAAAAVLLTAASLIALYAPGIAPDATSAGRHGLTVSTAARSARTVHVPLTVLPVPVPTIGAEGAWDPEATPNIALSRPQSFAGSTGTATGSTALTADPVATTTPLATEQPPTTLPGATRTWTRTTRTTPPTSPATSAAATSSAPTTTEETPVTVTEEPTPTDVLEEIVDEAVGEGA